MDAYVPSYFRSLSQIRTGNQSRIDEKANKVKSIRNDGSGLKSRQNQSLDLWVNEQAYHGRQMVTSEREIRVEESVDHPERHCWIVSDQLLETLEPTLREHADIFDLLISLNLCTDDQVFFSQSPGQVVSGAYTSKRARWSTSLNSLRATLRQCYLEGMGSPRKSSSSETWGPSIETSGSTARNRLNRSRRPISASRYICTTMRCRRISGPLRRTSTTSARTHSHPDITRKIRS